jgi:hypothetical protein
LWPRGGALNLDFSTVDGVLNLSVLVVEVIIGGYFIFFVLNSAMISRVYAKVGVPVWRAWLPVYQYWDFFKLAGKSGYWSLLGIFGGFELASILELPVTIDKLIQRIQVLGVTGDWSAAFNFGSTPGPFGLLWDTLTTVVPEAAIILLGILAAIAAHRVAQGFGKDPVALTAAFVLVQPLYFGLVGAGHATFDASRIKEQAKKSFGEKA